jgi:hypothetical protein
MKIPKLFIFSSGATWLKKSAAFISLFGRFSKTPPCKELVPDLEIVVMSATPPNFAELIVSPIWISSMALKDRNNSPIAEAPPTPVFDPGPTELMPSMLIEMRRQGAGYGNVAERIRLDTRWG